MTTVLDVARDIERATGKTPLTPRWEGTLRVFYGLELRPEDLTNLQASTHRTPNGLASLPRRQRRELWARVGRRGRKSVVSALVGLFEAMFGGHERYLLDGEKGLIAIVSKDTAGSSLVARFCELHANALGLSCNWSNIGAVRVLELDGFAFNIACFPCNAKAPRGWAIPIIIADEIAHWQTDTDSYTNTDESVLGAIKPAMAQFPDSRLLAISSPLGCVGLHYDTIEANLGDDADPDVLAVEGPTPEWNPEISWARIFEIEKDPDTRAREFGAVPSDSEGTAFVRSDADACFEPHLGAYTWGRPFLAIDPGETANTFSILVASWCQPSDARIPQMQRVNGWDLNVRDDWGRVVNHPKAERPLLRIPWIGGFTGEEVRAMGMERVMGEIARVADQHSANTVLSDQRGAPYIAALLQKHRLKLRSFNYTAQSKHEGVVLLRALMRDRQIAITEHAEMQNDLRTYPRRVVGGGFQYGARRAGSAHWDYASALLTIAHGLLEERGTPTDQTSFRIDGSPTQVGSGRSGIGPHRVGR